VAPNAHAPASSPPANSPRPRSIFARGGARAIVSGCLAGTLYGTWAMTVQWSRGPVIALRAAGVQALASFTTTVCMTALIEWLYRRGRTPLRGLICAAIGAPSIGFVGMFSAHTVARTPRVLATIAPSILIGALFAASYAFALYTMQTRPPASVSRRPAEDAEKVDPAGT
jgi:hypothetical protein